jgi:dTDP-4-dehydrorhamnose reductase
MKVLILGHKGMLGNAVEKFLKQKKINLITTNFRWPTNEFKEFIKNCNCDFIVNCIGSIPQRKSSFSVNHELPKWINENTMGKCIYPGTDCEVDMDEYGLSKKKAFDYICANSENTKIIKTSIIGHEINSQHSLLDWFLNENDEVNGYNNHFWNGNTTLQWSKVCYNILTNWSSYKTTTIIATNIVSKYKLLNIISEVYLKEIKINNYTHKKTVKNKCLVGNIIVPDIKTQLLELREFYNKEEKK